MLSPSISSAHTPLLSCFDNGDGTILCQAGFSNGNSAAGIKAVLADASGKELVVSKFDENGEITLDKPEGDYTVTMDGGEGHIVKVPSANITE